MDIYSRTAEHPSIRAAVRELEKHMVNSGFEILMGPPFYEPPIMFIGYQPGSIGKKPLPEKNAALQSGWNRDDQCQYAYEDWRLAKQLRSIYGSALLARCVGTNAIYVRAESAAIYDGLDKCIRKPVLQFCKEQTKALVEIIKPRSIVVIGLGTASLFKRCGSLRNVENRTLVEKCEVFGRSAIAIRHLTGDRLTTSERAEISNFLMQEANQIGGVTYG
jgi:hypothetical protein